MAKPKNSAAQMQRWAVAGLVFIINAFITGAVIDDGGFVSSVSALIALVLLMIPMVRMVLADLKSGKTHMHELVILAVLASCMQGDFTTSACIALFMLFSIIIETRTASGAEASLEALARLAPDKARRLRDDGTEEEIDPSALAIGDRIRVRPGESIVADGEIVDGRSSINEANITGESLPVDKQAGDSVFAGTANLTGLLDFTVVRIGADTTLGRVRELILEAEASRLPFVRMIDRYIRYYTPAILIIAATVLFFNRNEPDGLARVVALLVATCPIALILATPTAVVAALSAAARLGVLIKDVNDIEAMARINAFVFDKTGTLTTGHLEVARLLPAQNVDSAQLLRAAACGGAGSNHPVAGAVRRLAERANVVIEQPGDLHEEPGRGVSATFEGAKLLSGNLKWMEENNIEVAGFKDLQQADESGMSLLFVALGGKALGWIGISDTPRPDAADCVSALRELDVPLVAMVSGDRSQVAATVAGELHIDTHRGDCKPEEKVDYITEIRERGYRVAFVGDGVNDGPALASSNIGIAMGAAGSDLAMESATIALMNNDLNRLPFLVKLSRHMKQAVIQNLAVGGLIVFGGIGLAAAGQLSPIVAALFQAAGAVGVSMNSARLIREGEEIS
jgi:Cd2+/Zn2+-exporting ATPase